MIADHRQKRKNVGKSSRDTFERVARLRKEVIIARQCQYNGQNRCPRPRVPANKNDGDEEKLERKVPEGKIVGEQGEPKCGRHAADRKSVRPPRRPTESVVPEATPARESPSSCPQFYYALNALSASRGADNAIVLAILFPRYHIFTGCRFNKPSEVKRIDGQVEAGSFTAAAKPAFCGSGHRTRTPRALN